MSPKLGKYVIVEKLGEGAMGAVYKAYDEVLDRYVAIKTMAEDIQWNPELKLRFYREARSAAGLHHPNIVTIHDLGEEGEITYIVMEFLQGTNLKTLIREKALIPLEKKVSIMTQLADGIGYAHLHAIIHRDIKPGNIHLTASGTVKILDFGIARIPSSDLTRSGDRLGTPVYMSPEQIRGEEYDERSELFSAGIVFYELLTYVHPFRDNNIARTLDNILSHKHLPLVEQFPEAPPGLSGILNHCLAKESDRRYASMVELARACRRLSEELTLESQRMGQEIHRALQRLKQGAEQPGASPKLAQLLGEAQDLIGKTSSPDYLSLRRFIKALSEAAPLLQHASPVVSSAKNPEAVAQPSRIEQPEEEERRENEISSLLSQSRDALQRRDYQEATLRAHEILSLDPRNDAANSLLKRIELAEGEEPKQEKLAALLSKGKQALIQNDWSAASAHAREALRLEAGNEAAREILLQVEHAREETHRMEQIAALLEQGQQALDRGSLTKAATSAREVLGLKPDNQQALDLLKRVKQGQDAKKEQVAALLAQAEHALGQNDFDRAVSHAGDILRVDPKNSDGSNLLKRIEEAKHKYRRDRIETLLAQGEEALRQDEFSEAAEWARKILALDPQSSEGASLLTRIEETEKQRQEEKIAGLLAQAEKALEREDFAETAERAQAILGIDPANARARNLLSRIEQVKEKRKREQIVAALSEARQASERQDFEEAAKLAQEVLGLEPHHKEAKSLLKRIEKNIRAREREQRKLHRTVEKAAQSGQSVESTVAELDQTEILPRGSWIKPGIARLLLWIGSGILIVALVAASVFWRKEKAPPSPVDAMLAAAKTSLDQQNYDGAIEFAQQVLQTAGDNAPARARAQTLLDEATQGKKQKRIGRLLMDAQFHRNEGRLDDSRTSLLEILELDRTNEAASATLSEIDQEVAATKSREEQEQEIKLWLAKARQLIQSGKLDEAKVFIDRIQNLRPDSAEAKNLNRLWEKKSSELARAKKEGTQAGTNLADAEELKRKALDLFNQGKYPEARVAAQDWLDHFPGSNEAIDLRERSSQAERSVRDYESAFGDKNYDEASAALNRLGGINPADPRLPERRTQLEARSAKARASLTVRRLGEPGTLTLDGQELGTNGEVINESVRVGKHILAVAIKGQRHSTTQDFKEDSHEHYVYDGTGLRAFRESDRDIIKKREEVIEAVYSVEVEHPHTLVFIGRKCAGRLILTGSRVEYKPTEGKDGFNEAFQGVTLKREKNELEFKYSSKGKPITRTLKTSDESKAREVEKRWQDLQNLVR